MQKIVPCLWFDNNSQEAAEFYVSLFPNSKITNTTLLHDTPSGDVHTVSFSINGYEFLAMGAGSYFKITPGISFMVNFDPSKDPNALDNITKTWDALVEGGNVLMPFDKYDFSDKYGWVEDKFGVSWQLILSHPEGEDRPYIVPSFLFTEEMNGKTEEAVNFYLSVFKDSKMGMLVPYPAGMDTAQEGNVMYSDFRLENQWFIAMDGGLDHKFAFSEAVSLIINCTTQEELDYYSGKLSAVPESEQCGWVKDKYGVSWQITPIQLEEMLSKGTEKQKNAVTQALLNMKRLDLEELQKAFNS